MSLGYSYQLGDASLDPTVKAQSIATIKSFLALLDPVQKSGDDDVIIGKAGTSSADAVPLAVPTVKLLVIPSDWFTQLASAMSALGSALLATTATGDLSTRITQGVTLSGRQLYNTTLGKVDAFVDQLKKAAGVSTGWPKGVKIGIAVGGLVAVGGLTAFLVHRAHR